MNNLLDPVSKLHLVNPKALAALHNLKIHTVQDLLFYFPRDWQDLSNIQKIRDIRPGERINLKVQLKKINFKHTRYRRLHITEALLEDDTGNVVAVWFNQPFLKNSLFAGREYYMTGKTAISSRNKSAPSIQLQNPTFELVKEETIHTAGIVPLYDLTEGITQKQIRYWLKQSLTCVNQIPEPLPPEILDKFSYPVITVAVSHIHYPRDQHELELARDRVAFEELFLFQLALQSYKKKLKTLPAPAIHFDVNLVKKFVANLPYQLTNSQRLAVWEILKDLERSHPMNRLLEGEVGSGKTVVAGLAMLAAAQAGWQSVLLAPTEILALQHFDTLQKLFAHAQIEIAILTRSHKTHAPDRVSQIPIVVGTHALLQEKIKFQKIGLLVVDEQHRFGVEQRAKLASAKNRLVPHLLSMTATPIPRTLSLAFYGDLDISQLKQLPSGRKKVITRLVAPDNRRTAYEFIRERIKTGQQAYVVTPLIEESDPPRLALGEAGPSRRGQRAEVDKLGVKSATTEAENIKKIYPEFAIALLHGRMRGEEKKQIMNNFKNGKINILVSTTVIEVGVDVPNATFMIIENAERFGLSQLHQLRGRVGRSNLQSYCLLFAENAAAYTLDRLNAVVKSNDGFALAEKDLELRGSGEILGTRQSGFVPFRIAKLSDKKLIKQAKEEAEQFLNAHENLDDFPILKQKIETLAQNAHLE